MAYNKLMQRLLSGIQPSGKLHLGNFFGAVKNWVALQSGYEAFLMIADLHALTTAYEDGMNIREATLEMLADLVACGVDPKQATLFVQSDLPEHSELHLILSMITPLPWLERVPTYKSKKEEIQGKDMDTYGFLGYPVLQSADILLYQADIVPVGRDQAPHLELTREIARRFNHLFKTDFLKEITEKFTECPILPGTDGRKMSKSYGNAIYFADSDETITQKVKTMFTDPQRLRKTDSGRPDICALYPLHELLNSSEKNEIASCCKEASIGCVDCKKMLLSCLLPFMAPIREKRTALLADKSHLLSLIETGNRQARSVAQETLNRIKRIIRLKL